MNIIKSIAYNSKDPYIYAPLLRFDAKVLTIAPFKCKDCDISIFDLAIIDTATTNTTNTTTESEATHQGSEATHQGSEATHQGSEATATHESEEVLNAVTHKVRKITAEEKKVIDENHLHNIKQLVEELRGIVAAYKVIKNEELNFGALNDENDFVNLSCSDTSEFKSLLLPRCFLLMKVNAMIRLIEEKFNLL